VIRVHAPGTWGGYCGRVAEALLTRYGMWFDVVVLVETASPGAAGEVRAAPAYQAMTEALAERARRVHLSAARNVRRVGDVDKSRPARITPHCSGHCRARSPAT
jgi:hypothetical protein